MIVEDRVVTTVAKAKAVRPHVEKMITLGKKGDVHSRRLALSFLMTDKAVERLFDTVAPRYGDRQGGYLRIVRTGFQKGDGAEKAFIELLGSEQELDEKRQKRAEARAKRREEIDKAPPERIGEAALEHRHFFFGAQAPFAAQRRQHHKAGMGDQQTFELAKPVRQVGAGRTAA